MKPPALPHLRSAVAAFALAGLALWSPKGDAAPRTGKRKPASRTFKQVELEGAFPSHRRLTAARPTPARGSDLSDMKPLTKRDKLEIAKLAGFEVAVAALKKTIRLTPRAPYKNATTYMGYAGQTSSALASAPHGVTSVGKYDPESLVNYVFLRFKAAANTHYIVDCVTSGEDAQMRLFMAADNSVLSGTATITDDHVIRFIPARATSTTVWATVYNPKDWAYYGQCDITPVS